MMNFKGLELTLLAFLAVLLVSCASRSVRSEFSPVYFTDKIAVSILPVGSTAGLGETTQHIEGSYGEKNFSADAYIAANDSSFSVYLAGGFGTTIAELLYTKDSISFKSSVMDTKNVRAEYIVADFQVCYAPSEVLEKHFTQTSLKYAEEKTEDGFKRSLTDGKSPVMVVVKKGNVITLENKVRNYSYNITVSE